MNDWRIGLTKKYRLNYCVVLFFCLIVILISAISDESGNALFLGYIFSCMATYALTRSYMNVIYMSLTVLINSVLSDGNLYFLSCRRVLIVFTFVLFFSIFIKRNKNKQIVSGFYFAAWGLYILVDNVIFHGGSLIGLLSIGLFFFLSYCLEVEAAKDRKNAEKILLAIFVAFLMIVLVAYLELALGHTLFYSRWTGTERYRNGILRVGSTVEDPNNICFYIIPFLFLLETNAMRSLINPVLRRVVEVLILALVLLTSSRAGIVALLIGVSVYFLLKRKWYLIFGIPAIGLLSNMLLQKLELLLGQYQESTSYRNYIIETALLAWGKNPVVGLGGGAVKSVLNVGDDTLTNTMNTFVYMLMSYGLIGITFYIGFFVLLLKNDIKDWILRRSPKRDTLLKFCCTASLFVLAYTLDTFYMAPMWILPAFFSGMKFFEDEMTAD